MTMLQCSQVVGRENYEMLKKVRDSLELYDVIPRHQKALLQNRVKHSRRLRESDVFEITCI